jgi:hypothetical protein
MDSTTLVSDLVKDGKKIIEQLPQDGFEVTAAFWLKRAEDGRWRFYIISPVAESERINEAYSRLIPLIRRMPELEWLDPLEVRLIGPNDAIAKDVLAVHASPLYPKSRPIRWHGWKLGNVSVEGAYLYPLPAAAAG